MPQALQPVLQAARDLLTMLAHPAHKLPRLRLQDRGATPVL